MPLAVNWKSKSAIKFEKKAIRKTEMCKKQAQKTSKFHLQQAQKQATRKPSKKPATPQKNKPNFAGKPQGWQHWTGSYSDKAAKGGNQYLCFNENVLLLRHSYVILSHWYGITSVTDKPRCGNLLWKCVDYSKILWHEKSTKKPQQTCKVKK